MIINVLAIFFIIISLPTLAKLALDIWSAILFLMESRKSK